MQPASLDPTLRKLVIDWLDDNYHFGEAEQLIGSDDRSFLQSGILDSLGFVKLILHLEKTLGIVIDRKDLTPANFDGLAKIVGYVSAHPGYAARKRP
ncbi:MAG: acyl carrier protein [Planctomycetes bacterium]|nr:acyl carrier protein [Planctomycetota bacterium]